MRDCSFVEFRTVASKSEGRISDGPGIWNDRQTVQSCSDFNDTCGDLDGS